MLIPKIHWNVQTRCNLPCGFCYLWRVPGAVPMDTRVARQLISEAATISEWFVFGGGDPLMRADIVDLIRHAHDAGLRIDLQTNAVLFRGDTAASLLRLVNRVGLSLDGEDELTHGQMRGSAQNFRQVLDALRLCDINRVPVTIRTLVTPLNRGRLAGIWTLLADYSCVEKWSLRQFAALGRGERTRSKYSMSRSEFLHVSATIRTHVGNGATIPVSVVTVDDMENCFCLVSEDGAIYGHPTDAHYRSCGRFPEDSLAAAVDKLKYDHLKRTARNQRRLHQLPALA